MFGTVAVDWDGTLVDPQSQEWLPGGLDGLLELLLCFRTVIVHTCRAGWPEGRTQIEQKLAQAGLEGRVVLVAKPSADVYLDNRGVRFDGDWPAALVETLDLAAAVQRHRPPRRDRSIR